MKASVVGDPDFGGQLPQLAGARTEALTVAKGYGVKPLIGPEASESALRQSIGKGVDVLRLATHALYDPYLPLQSALILTDGKKAVPLTAERIFEKPLLSRLVILSACETGMEHVIGGDDILGLVRSFYLGGTSAVLSSLWPVEDSATRLFMETFHTRSKGGDFGGAWLAARDTLRSRGYSPSAYGAFILGGSLGVNPATIH
ncbi:MAG: CHAT domain-containing protein [Candidatus Omnitrophota bacterium]